MKRTNKKGFTIVELVIVIAVIAILAAVLIPNISRLVRKAQVSSDLSLVRNLNMALETESATMDYPTAYSAFQAVKENGYDIAKIEAKASNNQILYDEVNKCFAYMNGKNLEYYPNSTKSDKITPKHQLWMVVTSAEDAKNSEYSVYWNGASGAEITLSKAGFDAGDKTTKSVTYTGSQSVIIRTNGGDLIVNALNGHVEHYGLANTVEIKAISDTTYIEMGIVGKMTTTAEAKHVVIKPTAVVGELDNKSPKLVIENGGFVASLTGSVQPSSGAPATTSKVISVSTYEQLQGMAMASTVGVDLTGKTIELTNDIDLTGKDWKPFGFDGTNVFSGTIDGKGHTIKGLSPNGYNPTTIVANVTNQAKGVAYGFICVAKDATVKNINFVDVNIAIENGLAVGAVVGDARGSSLTIENVTVSGSVSAMDKVGGFVGLAGYNGSENFDLTIKNSTNNANITAKMTDNYNRAGGFVGGLGGSDKCKTVTFTKCVNNGNVYVTGKKEVDVNKGLIVMAGGFIGSINDTYDTATERYGKTYNVDADCVNNGTITVVNTYYPENGTATVTGMATGIRNNDGWVKVYPIFDAYPAN